MRKNIFKLISVLFAIMSLSGCVPVLFVAGSKSAIEVARSNSTSDALSDSRISSAIKSKFIYEGLRDLYMKISVEVLNGRVLYTGTVNSENDMIKAVEIAWSQKNVNEVINELKVDESRKKFSAAQYTKDSFITGSVKSHIFANRDIKFTNYTVITIDNVVYLFGVGKSEEEIQRVAEMASKIAGVTEVISHVKLKEQVQAQ